MDDINFDELDKAVNSALQQPSTQKTPGQEAPSVDTSEAQPVEPTEGGSFAQPPAKAIIPKRRGQFMDMVHPASDMLQPGAPQPKSPVVNRQSTVIRPLDPTIVEADTAVAEPVKQVGAAETMEPEDTPPREGVSEPQSEVASPAWPDPLDVMEQTEDRDQQGNTEADDVTRAEGATVADDGAVAEPESPAVETQATPFISGGEVEKRPLGAFAATEADDRDKSPVDKEVVATPVMPEELTPEVVSVESDEATPEEVAVEEPVATPDQQPQSIAQQYAASPVEGDDESHPVFDTKQYHQPIVPPVKQRMGGKAVLYALVTLLMLGLGALGGYLVWVLKLL